jgi:hypothetical protein
MSRSVLLITLLVACSGEQSPNIEIAADFTLSIVPHVVTGQDVFRDARAIKLLIRNTEDEVLYLGQSDATELRTEGLGPLVADKIGLIVEDDGTDGTTFDPDEILAYREFGPVDLTTEDITIDVLLAQRAEVGQLGTFALRTFGHTATMLPGGEVLMFGGIRENGSVVTNVQRLENLDGESWTFTDDGAMPGAVPTRVYGTATLVDDGGTPMVLVTGGRQDLDDPSTGRADMFLYDPGQNAVVWQDGNLFATRSEHQAFLMPTGDVIIVGGYADGEIDNTATYSVYNPENRTIRAGDDLSIPPLGFAGARIGNAGLLLCGGAGPIRDASEVVISLEASAACDRIDLNGRVAALSADLPMPVHSHSMVSLSAGRALVSGGVPDTLNIGGIANAHTEAWVFDASETSSWIDVPAMKRARGNHASVPMPDGRVMLIGGAVATGSWLPTPGTPVQCPEIFDPDQGEFENTSSCADPGSGVKPVTAWSETDGAFVMAGRWPNNNGGDDWGVIGFGPTMP